MSKNGKKLKRYACHYAPFSVDAATRREALSKFRAWCSGILIADVYEDGPDFCITVHADPDPPNCLPVYNHFHSLDSRSVQTYSFGEQLKLDFQ